MIDAVSFFTGVMFTIGMAVVSIFFYKAEIKQ